MLLAVKGDMLVDFIAYNNDIGILETSLQFKHILFGENSTAGIVWSVYNDHFGPWRNFGSENFPVYPKIGIV